ncbi:DUF5132 domain-containing protein [Methylocystis parvus]|nr:DUF5132 domain-containing protein [Methylocystis parvus]WBK01816.1 DUF5132 domain-containing protein [Methylocystis parvus OBBP]
MAHIGRSLLLALAAGAAGGAAATLLNRDNGQKRSLAKGAVRAGVQMYDRLRGVVGEAAETMSDVVAEVRSELETERSDPHPDGAHKEDAREHIVPFGAKPEAERKAHG